MGQLPALRKIHFGCICFPSEALTDLGELPVRTALGEGAASWVEQDRGGMAICQSVENKPKAERSDLNSEPGAKDQSQEVGH